MAGNCARAGYYMSYAVDQVCRAAPDSSPSR